MTKMPAFSVGAIGYVRECLDCGLGMPISRINCPHCGRPSLFPNVDLAEMPVEQEKLQRRFDRAMQQCKLDGLADIAQNFIQVCENSTAAFACTIQKLHRQVATGTDIFECYYHLERLRVEAAAPNGLDWKKLRPQAEIELLGTHHHIDRTDELHYACLTLDAKGLESYGECLVQLAEPMIAHRTSCFEGNTAIIFEKHRDFSDFLRCNWSDRHKICVAAFSSLLSLSCVPTDFPHILTGNGVTQMDDRFIEVQIFGSMTAKTFKSVTINATKHTHREDILREIVQEKLVGVVVEVTRT